MTKARDISKLLSTANGKIAGANLDVSFENISDTGTQGTKVATGTTGQRGSTAGQIRFNTTTGLAEYYTGSEFKIIDSPPTVISVSPLEVDSQAGGNITFTITGSNFQSGAVVKFIGSDNTEITASTVTVNSSSSISAVIAKSSFVNAKEPYDVKVINTSGLSGILDNQISVDTSPTWSTASGTLATINDNATGTHATVSATDADGDTVSYSETGGTVLTTAGLTLNSSTGAISGNPTDVGSSTTYSFNLRATANSKTVDRAFNIIVTPELNGSTSARAVTHPDQLAALGLTSGNYYVTIGGTARLVECVIGQASKNWVALTPANFFESLNYTTQSNSGVTNYGWFNYNGKRYFQTYPNSTDYEVWNKFTISDFSFRYISGYVYMITGNDSTIGSSHPDNDLYDNFRDNDTDYNALGYNSEGSGNKSWWRFGIYNQFQLAYDELGFTSLQYTESSAIYIGAKTSNFKSGVSRFNTGSNTTSYIDLGSSTNGRIIMFSTFNESGAPPYERISWSPTRILIS
ncbi:hypothetical protein EBU71_12180 [bacterium]|nr:hypothetical protein [Candidatus Elulimicrobium humile]